jgi:hypothetical protein
MVPYSCRNVLQAEYVFCLAKVSHKFKACASSDWYVNSWSRSAAGWPFKVPKILVYTLSFAFGVLVSTVYEQLWCSTNQCILSRIESNLKSVKQ